MQTFGWDTVFVVKAEAVNALFRANADKTVLKFDTPLPNLPDSRASGTFSAWQITDGGSNEIIHLKLGIAEGSVQYKGKSWNLAGLTLVIATYLRWIGFDANKVENLVFDYDRLGEAGQPPKRGELSVIALRDPAGTLPPDVNALTAYALGDFLVKNAAQVKFVFASVNLVPPSDNGWLAPKKSRYGYFLRAGSTEAFLAVLSVTTNRDISGLQVTVDPAALPTASNACFVISDALYLSNVIAPSLARALNNAPPDAIYYDANVKALRNKYELRTRTVRSGLIDYYPFVRDLEVRSGTGALLGRFSGGCDMKAGIWMSYTVTTRNAGTYNAADGTFAFSPDPRPGESHSCDIPWWWWIGGPIVIAVVELCVKIIGDDIANQISNDNRERLAFGKRPPSSIAWGGLGSSPFKVTAMGIDGGMWLQGTVAQSAPAAKPSPKKDAVAA